MSSHVLKNAWHIQDQYGLSWWETLIVSTAQVAGCRYLLSEDLQGNQEFGDLRVANPFNTQPAFFELKISRGQALLTWTRNSHWANDYGKKN